MNREVADLFQELASLTPAEREIYFLEQRVPSDVRSQVESLLAYDSGHEHLLTEPVAEWAEQLLQKLRGHRTRRAADLCFASRL